MKPETVKEGFPNPNALALLLYGMVKAAVEMSWMNAPC